MLGVCVLQIRMKKSPIYPGYEGGDHGFDPQMDFSLVQKLLFHLLV